MQKKGYDLDNEFGNVQAFIDEFKDRQLEKEKLGKEKLEKISNRTRRQNKRKRRRITQKNKRARSQSKRTRRQMQKPNNQSNY